MLDRVIAPTCIICGAPGEQRGLDLCMACRAELPTIGAACERCGWPFAGPAPTLCGRCLGSRSAISATRCAYRYAWPVDHLLRALKYRHVLSHARVLGLLLADRLQQDPGYVPPDLVCPVPLGRRRYAERGFNQSLEIGRVLAARLGVPLRAQLLERVRETPEQVGLSRAARRRNVREAFAVTGEVDHGRIAILDDVVTTGSTVGEIARLLQRAGAARLEAWAVARAVH
jgi:ComF family protein